MKKKRSIGEKIFDVSNVVILALVSLTFVFPFYVILVNSFTAEKFLTSGSLSLWPQEFNVNAYKVLLTANSKIVNAFIVSIASTLIGTIQGMLIITLFGYAMAKEWFPFKKAIMILVIFTMMFSGGLIPTYLVFQAMKLTNTFYVLMIFHAFNAGYMIFIRNYFMSIPKSLPESAKLDGASEYMIFFKIMLPLSKPMLACMALFTAVGIYNDWTTPLFYINNEKWVTLQLLLKRILVKIEALSVQGAAVRTKDTLPAAGIKAATVVIVLAPILMVYPFVQKYFISGVWTGALKE